MRQVDPHSVVTQDGRDTAPVVRSEVQWISFVISTIGLITWALGRYVFRGAIPAEVIAFIQYTVPLLLGSLAGEVRWRTARRRTVVDLEMTK